MLMSAKTPGFNVARLDSIHKLAMHPRQQQHPPLLVNLGARANDGDNPQSSIIFGPGGAMFLPIESSNDVQLVDQQEGSTTLLSAAAVFESPSPPVVTEAQSLPTVVISDNLNQPSAVSPLIASALGSTSTPSTTSSSSSSSPPTSNGSSSASQAGSQSTPQSQIQAVFTTSIISSTTRGAASATTPPTLTSAIPSPTTSQALSSPSSTSELQRDVASLPRVAEIVIGVVGAISLIAFLATLGSWIYKQCHRRRQHAEIISIASFGDTPSRGFFGCLKKRNDKHADDMSELGFGLGRVTFFGEPNSGDEHHRVGLASGAENVVLEDAGETNQTFPVNPFADHLGNGFVRRAPTMIRQRQDDEATDAESSISIFPYQHLASANALGGASATPLKVTNIVPGDTNGIEDGGHETTLRAPVTRYPSVGTPRIGVSNPRFMSLVEDEALSVPWAPLDIRRSELRSVEENKASSDLGDEERDTGFRQVQLSRTETLTLAVSKSFSQRLGRSFSKTINWRNVLTQPPPGTFQVARERDNTECPITTSRTEKHWTTTLKNNFYSALNAVGSSIHGAGPGSHNVDLEAPPVHTAQSNPELSVVPYRNEIKDPLEDIFTPPPARVVSVRLGRTKGSIIRGHLGITAGGGLPELGMGLGLGLESLSRSSTLSTCWSDNEKDVDEEMVRKVRMRVRGLSRSSRRQIQRSDTGSTVSSVTCPVAREFMHSGRGRVGSNVRNMKPSIKRPRISRVPVSQSSVWSSTSYASTNGGEERRGRI